MEMEARTKIAEGVDLWLKRMVSAELEHSLEVVQSAVDASGVVEPGMVVVVVLEEMGSGLVELAVAVAYSGIDSRDCSWVCSPRYCMEAAMEVVLAAEAVVDRRMPGMVGEGHAAELNAGSSSGEFPR